MADTLIKQLQQDGTYTIISDDTADAIVYCTLRSIDPPVPAFGAEQRSRHERI